MIKVYMLTIAYNETTEEIEYIHEEMAEEGHMSHEEYVLEYEDGFFDDEELLELLSTGEVGEA